MDNDGKGKKEMGVADKMTDQWPRGVLWTFQIRFMHGHYRTRGKFMDPSQSNFATGQITLLVDSV